MISEVVTFVKVNAQWLTLAGLQNQRTKAYINTATVTATLKDAAGTPVTGINSLALSHVAGSNGDYEATVTAAFDPPAGDGYMLEIDAGALGFHLEIPAKVEERID